MKIFSKKIINKTVPIICEFTFVAVFLLLFISLQGQISQLHATDKTHLTTKGVTEYPTTPEGIVGNVHRQQNDASNPDRYSEVKNDFIYDSLTKRKKRWHVTVYEAVEDKRPPFEQPAAKICFWYEKGKTKCQLIEDNKIKYQRIERIEKIQFNNNHGILLIARNLNPTIGKIRLISLWAYNEKNAMFVNLMPSIRLTDISEFKFYPTLARSIIFITADRIWSGEENLLGSSHNFKIEVFEYDEGVGLFKLISEYITKNKYRVADESGGYGVIKTEFKNIQNIVRKKDNK